MKLWPFRRRAELAAPREIMGEVASIERDHRQLAWYGGRWRNTDPTLRQRGGGKGLRLYDEIARDTRAFAALQKRRLAVTAREWRVEPASESDLDVRAAEEVERQLGEIDFDRITREALSAQLYGFSVGEVMWRQDGARLVVDDVIARAPDRFVFGGAGELFLLTDGAPVDGVAVPERKFIHHTFGGTDGTPYGLGLGALLWWPVYFKRQGVTFWLRFADRFGSPTPVGKYPAGALEGEKQTLLAAIRAFSQNTGIILPASAMLELVESKGTSTDAYEKLVRWLDEQITEAVLGQSMTTHLGEAGSRAAVSELSEVELTIVRADSDELSATFNDTLVAWITELNVPGAVPPSLWRVFDEPEDEEIRLRRAAEVREWLAGGLAPPVPTAQAYELLGLTPPEGGEAVIEAKAPMPMPMPLGDASPPPAEPDEEDEPGEEEDDADAAAMAEAPADPVDALLAQLVEEGVLGRDFRPIEDAIREVLDGAIADGATWDEFRRRLTATLSELEPGAFAETLARSMFFARMAGETGADE